MTIKKRKNKQILPNAAIEKRLLAKQSKEHEQALKKRRGLLGGILWCFVICLFIAYSLYLGHVRKTAPYHNETMVVKLKTKGITRTEQISLECISTSTNEVHRLHFVGFNKHGSYHYGDTLIVRFYEKWPYPYEIISANP